MELAGSGGSNGTWNFFKVIINPKKLGVLGKDIFLELIEIFRLKPDYCLASDIINPHKMSPPFVYNITVQPLQIHLVICAFFTQQVCHFDLVYIIFCHHVTQNITSRLSNSNSWYFPQFMVCRHNSIII